MKIKLILFGILIFNTVQSQTPSFEWAKKLGGTNVEEGMAITTDASGNSLSTGYFKGTVDFDPGPGTYTLSSYGAEDVYVVKLDPLGNFIWACQLGGSLIDQAFDVTCDQFSNVYVTGNFQGTADFDPAVSSLTFAAAGNADAFILKLSSVGSLVWAKQLEGDNWGEAQSLKVDLYGNVFTVGIFTGIVDFDPGPAVVNVSGFNGSGFILKLDPIGDYLWTGNFNGAPQAIDADASGNIYVTGHFTGTTDFDLGPGTFYLFTGPMEIFVTKLDNNGGFIGAVSMGGPQPDLARDICIDINKNVLITGSFNVTADFDPGPGTYTITSKGFDDIFVAKLDSMLNFTWAAAMGSSTSEHGYGIQTDTAGYVYSTGYFIGNVDFDPGPGTYTFMPSNFYEDGYISKLSPAGNFVWAVWLGNNGSDRSYDLHVDEAANIYSTGYFQNTVDFDPGPGTSSLTMAGGLDSYVHKLAKCNIPSPPLNTSPSGALSICDRQSTILSMSSVGLVSWYSSATATNALVTDLNYTTTILATGTYTYYAGAYTCDQSASRTVVTVTVHPNVSATVSSLYICEGESTVLYASGAYSFTWSTGQVSNSITVSPVITSTFSVQGNATQGCNNSAMLTVSVSACVGLGSNTQVITSVEIFPNPFSEILTIHTNKPGSKLYLFDPKGILVHTQEITEEYTTLNCDLAAGVYFLRYGAHTVKVARVP